MDIKLLKLDTRVKFGENYEFKGEISAITIRKNIIMYEVSFWKGDEPKTLWLREEHLKLIKKETMQKIGFIDEKVT
jgi:hypothetical protein